MPLDVPADLRFYDTKQVAEILHLSVCRVRQLIRESVETLAKESGIKLSESSSE